MIIRIASNNETSYALAEMVMKVAGEMGIEFSALVREESASAVYVCIADVDSAKFIERVHVGRFVRQVDRYPLIG